MSGKKCPWLRELASSIPKFMLSNVTTQLRWLLDNIREVASCSNLKFGTVDSWLIYNLTGGDRDRVRINDAQYRSPS